MSHIKKGEGNSLGDMLNPEVRNILEKLKRLGVLTYQMGVDNDKGTDIKWLSENLEKTYSDHKNFKEVIDLCVKLKKLKVDKNK
tara:strand:+ start:147 stop:398 length:252 start_codon:yes stop_codon:yes gene_type:complete